MNYLNILVCLALGLSLFLTLVNLAILKYTLKASREYLKLMHESNVTAIRAILDTGNSVVKKIEELSQCPKQQD